MIGVNEVLGMPTVLSASRYHDFSYGHVVLGHESKCANLHGHNGRVHFTCQTLQQDQVGRVIDFSVIKQKLCQWVEDNWDHKFLISQDHEWAQQLKALDPNVEICAFNPTAENMADYILNSVAPMLFMPHGLICTSVELWETENCCAVASLPEPTKEQVTWATRTLQSK